MKYRVECQLNEAARKEGKGETFGGKGKWELPRPELT